MKKSNAGGYDDYRDRMGKRAAAQSRAGRDIAPIPPVADPERKIICCRSFCRFCEIYLPESFALAWSADHRRMIAKIEAAVLGGGYFAMAMPRGSGKTTLVEAAAMWAVVTGARRFVVILGSDGDHADGMLDSIKTELITNTMLAADWPEVIYPILRLENIAQRAGGQLCDGKSTAIHWGDDTIVMPTIAGSRASGAILRSMGLTAGVRGMKFKRQDGTPVRPDFVLLDDPQTDESANSDRQNASREKIIKGAVLGLAGPRRKIAAVMPCTVIAPGDMVDRFLDRTKHPEWQGERTRMLYGWPKREDLWEQYDKIRRDCLQAGKKGSESTEFYRANREAMDDGCQAAWPVRHNVDELSAIQNAMNLCLNVGKPAFFAEYQNEPIKADEDQGELTMTADLIAATANGLGRGLVPADATKLVAFVDVQKESLYYVVVAVQEDFTGHVVDYGTYPDQKREYFSKRDVRLTLMKVEKAARFEESLAKGLDSIANLLLAREWQGEDGSLQKIARCLVDAHWGESTDLVRKFCRKSVHAAVLTPSFGMGITASQLPLNEKGLKKGDKHGLNWRMPKPKPGNSRHVIFDANYFKTFVRMRFSQSAGGIGSWTIFGSAEEHRLFADHLTAEYGVVTEGRGRKVIEWDLKPSRPDNEWLDGTVGCAVAASIEGAALPESKKESPRKKTRIRLSEREKAGTHG